MAPHRVFQRIVDPDRGDCYRAAVATILGYDLDVVPEAINDGFTEAGWLAQMGWCAVHLEEHWLGPRPETYGGRHWDARRLVRYDMAAGARAIASVPSQMFPGKWHAIVVDLVLQPEGYVRIECIHDPNPGNAPYDMEATHIRSLTFYLRSARAVEATVAAFDAAGAP